MSTKYKEKEAKKRKGKKSKLGNFFKIIPVCSGIDGPRVTIQTPGISLFPDLHYALFTNRLGTANTLPGANEARPSLTPPAV